jgi:hypothetical protein
MKISTLRTCLFLLNVLIVAGIGYVVFQGFQEKKRRPDELRAYKQKIVTSLNESAGGTAAAAGGRREYPNLASVSLQGEPPKAVETAPVVEEPKKPIAPPLEGLVTITGIEFRSNPADPSLIFYVLGAPGGAVTPAASPMRIPQPIRTTAAGSGTDTRILVAAEGSVIELGNGFEALLKTVTVSEVTFVYDGQEVALAMKPSDPNLQMPAGGSGSSVSAAGPISNDPGVWIAWNPTKPQDGIALTEMGVRALKQKGESVFEGVRFESEKGPDGKEAIKLSHIPQNSVLRKAGAEDSDVFTHINDTRISTKPDVIRYLEANPNLPEYRVTFLRRGNTYTRIVRPPR